jgi:hypothetical protein
MENSNICNLNAQEQSSNVAENILMAIVTFLVIVTIMS